MRLSYEPPGDDVVPTGPTSPTRASEVRFLGIEAVRAGGRWPILRHVFDLDNEAGLHVELNPLGALDLFAVGYDLAGDERLTPL